MRATNWIGDAVMSLPALRAIREIFPHAHITVLAKPWVGDLYARETVIDRVIPYTGTRREIAALGWYRKPLEFDRLHRLDEERRRP